MSKRYQLPEERTPDSFKRKAHEISQKLKETEEMLHRTKQEMRGYLEKENRIQVTSISLMLVYKWFARHEKGIYDVLNKMQLEGNIFYGFVWSHQPRHQLLSHVYKMIDRREEEHAGYRASQVQIEEVPYKKLVPPTSIPTNEFTSAFQEIVNTYGVPSYKEFNPAVHACITFPFLFGVMFGDMGHGGALAIMGGLMCLFYGRLSKMPAVRGMLHARYLILLMGLFAFFAGFIYNDFMAIPVYFFDSCYVKGKQLPDCTYKAGIDPVWYSAKNELQFMNSLKMKLSVILGVAQMSIGIILKGANAIFFRDKTALLHEFLPQLILLLSLFGYMDLLIVLKWLTNYTGHESEAPSIISTMINLALKGGQIDGSPFIGSLSMNKAVANILLCKRLFILYSDRICLRSMDAHYEALYLATKTLEGKGREERIRRD